MTAERARVMAIVNPVAGGGRAARVWARLDLGVACVATERPGHARELARAAAERGVERVIVVGGDGTVSEAAGGLQGTDTALAVVPAGTGNDFGRGLGVLRDLPAAGHLALNGAAR